MTIQCRWHPVVSCHALTHKAKTIQSKHLQLTWCKIGNAKYRLNVVYRDLRSRIIHFLKPSATQVQLRAAAVIQFVLDSVPSGEQKL